MDYGGPAMLIFRDRTRVDIQVEYEIRLEIYGWNGSFLALPGSRRSSAGTRRKSDAGAARRSNADVVMDHVSLDGTGAFVGNGEPPT